MSSKKMVTRTFITTNCNVMLANPENGEISYRVVKLSGTFHDNEGNIDTKAITKKLRKMFDADTESVEKFVTVTGCDETEQLYGMDEDKFLANAELLPPRKSND